MKEKRVDADNACVPVEDSHTARRTSGMRAQGLGSALSIRAQPSVMVGGSSFVVACFSILLHPTRRPPVKLPNTFRPLKMCSSSCLLAIIAIIFPPLPVWIRRGLCSADSLINIALCLLGFLPGLIHAWYIISITPEDYEVREGYIAVPANYDVERGAPARVSYYLVSGDRVYQNPAPAGQRLLTRAPAPRLQTYGTVPAQPQPHVQPSAGASSSAGDQAPPPYNEAVPGDNKIQHK